MKAAGMVVLLVLLAGFGVRAGQAPVSEATENCIACHESLHPGIVSAWRRSMHSMTTPAEAMKKPDLQRRVSAGKIPDRFVKVVVGCAECHGIAPDSHADSFEHNDYKVHVVVTPKDCAVCHPSEAREFDENIMARAWGNLSKNKLYTSLVKAVNGVQSYKHMETATAVPDELTDADSCYNCHGTRVKVTGKRTKETDHGSMEFPILDGWPNQGVGRINPDGSRGACTSCHSRHRFSMETARKPHVCSKCHKGPDVPAYSAYSVSRHGNLFSSEGKGWNMRAVPWTVGKDFSAPTCATCHVSLLVDADGEVIAKRSHRMNDRLPWRLLGLVYAHPHPKSPDTSVIRNADGQPLPTTLEGTPAAAYLIGPKEMKERRARMQRICRSCHSEDWVTGHWRRFEHTIETTNRMTLASTKIMMQAWKDGAADQAGGLFDEAMERRWVEQWLFYANSTRFASAMMGADYGVFANGRWYLSRNVQELLDSLKIILGLKRTRP